MKHFVRLLAIIVFGSIPTSNILAKQETKIEGKIWRVQDQTFISARQLINDISEIKFILIGERHGRKAHQDREAFLLTALAARGRFPGLVLEMLTNQQTTATNNYRKRSPENAAGLGAAIDWHRTNWPDWNFYQPVFDVAFMAKLKIVGSDLPDKLQKEIMKGAVTQHAKDAGSLSSWASSLKKSHCNLISKDRLAKFSNLQVFRDQSMARILKESATLKHGAVLIAGSAHTRKDRSVPTYLPQSQFVSIAIMETNKGTSQNLNSNDPSSKRFQNYDYIWFTPRQNTQSVCDRLKGKGLLPK